MFYIPLLLTFCWKWWFMKLFLIFPLYVHSVNNNNKINFLYVCLHLLFLQCHLTQVADDTGHSEIITDKLYKTNSNVGRSSRKLPSQVFCSAGTMQLWAARWLQSNLHHPPECTPIFLSGIAKRQLDHSNLKWLKCHRLTFCILLLLSIFIYIEKLVIANIQLIFSFW